MQYISLMKTHFWFCFCSKTNLLSKLWYFRLI